jgi:hypothetical protein
MPFIPKFLEVPESLYPQDNYSLKEISPTYNFSCRKVCKVLTQHSLLPMEQEAAELQSAVTAMGGCPSAMPSALVAVEWRRRGGVFGGATSNKQPWDMDQGEDEDLMV